MITVKNVKGTSGACTGKNSGLQLVIGVTVAHRGCVQGLTEDYRVYRSCVQGLTGDAQGMTGKAHGLLIRKGVFRASSDQFKINIRSILRN